MNKFFVSILFGLMLLSGAYSAPTTTFSSFQVPNTSDQNITLTCADALSGCKYINYNIDNSSWLRDVNGSSELINATFEDNNVNNPFQLSLSSGTLNMSIVNATTMRGNYYLQGVGSPGTRISQAITLTKTTNDFNYIIRSSNVASGAYFLIGNNSMSAPNNALFDITLRTSKFQINDADINASCAVPSNNTNYLIHTRYTNGASSFTYKIDNNDGTNICKGSHAVTSTGTPTKIGIVTNVTIGLDNIVFGSLDKNIKFSNILYAGAGDHNIKYFSTDNSDNNETTKVGTWTTYGSGHFQFYDENTGLALTGVSVDGNTALIGNTYDTNLQGITAQTKTYTFTKSGYSTRYYTRDINQLIDFNVQFALLPTTLSTALTFTLRQPTTLTAMTSAIVTITKGTNTVFRGVTDSLAALTDISLNADNNAARYAMNIVYGANTYDWNGLTLTISVPKNEKNTAATISPFDATITGVASYNLTNKTTAQTIVLFTDLQYTTPYSVIIGDYNATVYNDRRYDLWFTGLTTAYTLQPYLLLTTDSTAIKFITLNEYNNPIQGIRMDVSKTLGGVKTLMSSSRTDATGIALFYLYVNDQYQLDMYYEDTALYSSTNYTVTTSPVYFYLNLTTLSVTSVDQNGSSITWNTGYNIPTTTTSLITTITNASAATISYFQYDANDGSTGGASHVIATATAVCTSGTCTITKTMADLITGGLDNNKQFYATVTVIATTGYSFTQTTVFLYNYLGKASIQQLFVNVRKDFSCNPDTAYPCSPLLIISIILTIIAIATIFTMFGYSGTTGISILTLIILGLFTYIGWFYWVLFIPIAAVIILANARSFTGGGFYE